MNTFPPRVLLPFALLTAPALGQLADSVTPINVIGAEAFQQSAVEALSGIPNLSGSPAVSVAANTSQVIVAGRQVFRVYDPNLNPATGPLLIRGLHMSSGGPCATSGGREPEVYVEPGSQRAMILSTSGDTICLAVSQTPDAAGAYDTYEFDPMPGAEYSDMNLAMGVDTVMVSCRSSMGFGWYGTALAIELAGLISGVPTPQSVSFHEPFTPRVGLNYMSVQPNSLVAGYWGMAYDNESFSVPGVSIPAGKDGLLMWGLVIDWNNPGSASLSIEPPILIDEFDSSCAVQPCIPQAGSNQAIRGLHSEYLTTFNAYANGGEILIDAAHNVAGPGSSVQSRTYSLSWTTGWTVDDLEDEGADVSWPGASTFGLTSARTGNGIRGMAYSGSGGSLNLSGRTVGRAFGDTPNAVSSAVNLGIGSGPASASDWRGTTAATPAPNAEFDIYTATTRLVNDEWRIRLNRIRYDHLTGGLLGLQYCEGNPNSTGQPTQLEAFGSYSLSANDVTLEASSLPAGQFGYALFSKTPTAGTPVSSGNLCLGGTIVRINGPGDVIQGPTGQILLDYGGLAGAALTAGETAFHQLWHRDVGGQSNFSNSLGITVSF